MRTNTLTTIGGIMALFTALPPAMGQANMHAPNWLNLTCFMIGTLGMAVVGFAAKGQDVHSTPDQVQQSGEKAAGQNAAAPPKP